MKKKILAAALILAFAACGGGGSDDNDGGDSSDDISRGGDSFCLNNCAFADDGECDDTGPGAISSSCVLGTDCDDCGSRPAPAPGRNGLSCSDECVFAGDGECDDGRDPNFALNCPPATDCTDCGPLNLVAAYPGAFSKVATPSLEAWFTQDRVGSKVMSESK